MREVFVCEEGPNPVWKLVLWPMCLACSLGVQTERLLFGLSQAFELQWYDKGSMPRSLTRAVDEPELGMPWF